MRMTRLGGTIGGAVANLAAQGVPFLLLLVVTPILLRALGREAYGALILFNLVPQIAGQLDLGLSTAATRGFTQYAARGDRDGARRLFREALALLVGWGAVLGAIFYAAHPAIAAALKLDTIVPDDATVYRAAALAVPLALANSAALVPLRAVERYGSMARVQVTVGIVYWTACAWWAPRGGTLTQLVVLGTVTVAVATVALYVIARREHATPPEGSLPLEVASGPVTGVDGVGAPAVAPLALLPSGPAGAPPRTLLLRPFLRLGAGAFVAQASSLATYNADKLLVSALISPAAAGAYAICTSIANKILLVIASGATFTFPRAARLHAEGDLERVENTYAFATRICLLIAAALAIPLIALAPAFLRIWIGPAFANDYALTFRLLTVGYAITASSVVASNVAVGIGEVALPAAFALLGGTVTLVAVWLLAPRYGAPGAAGAAVIGMTQSLVFNDLIARRIGPAARRASWPLVARIVAIGVPVGVATAAAAGAVAGWISLFALGGLAVVAFAGLWLMSFGRVAERELLVHLFLRTRHGSSASR